MSPPPPTSYVKTNTNGSDSLSEQDICQGLLGDPNRINPRLLVFISRLILLVESLNTLSIIFSATGRLISLKNTGGSNRNLRADLDVTAERSLRARDNADGGARARLFLSDKLR